MPEDTAPGIPVPEPYQPPQPQQPVTQPVQATPSPAKQADPANPPGDGEEALHHAGTELLNLEGVTFPPDGIVIVSAALAAKLAGTNNLRIVQESAESWPHYLALRQRARAGTSG